MPRAVVASVSDGVVIGNSGKAEIKQEFTISDPHLWSVDDPYLHTLVTTVMKDNEIRIFMKQLPGLLFISIRTKVFF